MPTGMIGREREVDAAAGFVSELQDGPAVLVFAGEPGIGKTTVWREAVGRARALPVVVLSTRPVQTEAGLAFAGLADPVSDSWTTTAAQRIAQGPLRTAGRAGQPAWTASACSCPCPGSAGPARLRCPGAGRIGELSLIAAGLGVCPAGPAWAALAARCGPSAFPNLAACIDVQVRTIFSYV